jgi:SAM-dependent methyltransferase
VAKIYQHIVSHYESRLEEHGDSHLGVDWPDPVDAETRYRVHLDLIKPVAGGRPIRLLDLGCGASHLYEYILRHRIPGIAYSGLDMSARFVELSRTKHPEVTYYCLDILDKPGDVPRFDYVVMNGVLTEKCDLTYDAMLRYAQELIRTAFEHADVGLSFNVMSKHVDWERADLFHVPFDTLAGFLTSEISRSFLIRNDYGLYEYTTYVYR